MAESHIVSRLSRVRQVTYRQLRAQSLPRVGGTISPPSWNRSTKSGMDAAIPDFAISYYAKRN